ncbi:hypothetical protein DQ237_00945 [Blastococcus sp. TF02-8]|uniref:hypothetical protein n=1 Tax=Blastococcus sp. TF02-8 TaxID=2250574 RepID=UPI000DE98907|nr:hypothetical protein [Blastococcus sp. TF02-8]RBY97548.1 hypothetical protein DQ237_00945 [Blastococcus sp. TF02-8]
MRGIATIDRQPDTDAIAVWITNRLATEVSNTNAVVIDAANDPDAMDKVRSLTHSCVVLVTDGSVLDGLPVKGEPLTRADIELLVASTHEHQQAILDAIAAFKRRGGSKAHKEPTFPVAPDPADFVPAEDTPSQRALTTANHFGHAWRMWLRTDEERRRRTARPGTGQTPWIMPTDLNAPELAEFPEAFAARVHEQALV